MGAGLGGVAPGVQGVAPTQGVAPRGPGGVPGVGQPPGVHPMERIPGGSRGAASRQAHPAGAAFPWQRRRMRGNEIKTGKGVGGSNGREQGEPRVGAGGPWHTPSVPSATSRPPGPWDAAATCRELPFGGFKGALQPPGAPQNLQHPQGIVPAGQGPDWCLFLPKFCSCLGFAPALGPLPSWGRIPLIPMLERDRGPCAFNFFPSVIL